MTNAIIIRNVKTTTFDFFTIIRLLAETLTPCRPAVIGMVLPDLLVRVNYAN